MTGKRSMKNKIWLVGLSLTILVILNSCTSDKELTGTYYIDHDNSIEEYLIMQPDSSYVQFLIYENITIKENRGIYAPYPDYGKHGITLNHYKSGFDSYNSDLGKYLPHDSSQVPFKFNTRVDWTIFGTRQINIEFIEHIFINTISPSTNSDSILTEISNNLN